MFSKFTVKSFRFASRLNHTAAEHTPSTFKLDFGAQNQIESAHPHNSLEMWMTNYRIDFAKQNDIHQILKFIEKNYFCKEPLCKTLQLSYKGVDSALEKYIKQSLAEGMTIVARQKSEENAIMGICINRKSSKWDGDRLEELAKNADNVNSKIIMYIWALLEREPGMNDYLKELTIFNMTFLTVKKSLQSHGLATELARRSLALGRDLNYKFARIDCTGLFTKNIAEKLGMERLWDVPYKNILSEDDRTPVAIPEPPNTHAAAYYINLKTMPDELEELERFAFIKAKSKETSTDEPSELPDKHKKSPPTTIRSPN